MLVLNHLTQEPFAVTCNHWLFKSVTSTIFGTRGVKIKGTQLCEIKPANWKTKSTEKWTIALSHR